VWRRAAPAKHNPPVPAAARDIAPATKIGHPRRGAIWLEVNGERRQQADISDMIWSIPEIIAELSRLVALAPGDVIFTGTPAGVGQVLRGDRLRGGVDGVGELAIEIA
jgi:fumarylpyruvate hydrolase